MSVDLPELVAVQAAIDSMQGKKITLQCTREGLTRLRSAFIEWGWPEPDFLTRALDREAG